MRRIDGRIAPWSRGRRELAGRLDEHELESDALRGNPLGDPHARPLWVYAPPAYAAEPTPLPVDLPDPGAHRAARHVAQPLRRSGRTCPSSSTRSSPTRAARPRSSSSSTRGRRTAARSSSTRPASGNYHTYLCDEVVPFVDARYRTLAGAAHRGITGKSSGGYGAMVTPMLRPDLFGGLATHAGDALFELCYLPGLPRRGAGAARRVRRLVRRASGRTSARGPRSRRAPTSRCSTRRRWPRATRRTRTARSTCRSTRRPGELRDDVWERWLAWDPVRMADAPRRRAARAARDLHRRGQARPVLPRPRRRGVPARARADRRHRRLLRALRRRRTARSSTATRSRCATSPSASSRRRSRSAGAAARRRAGGSLRSARAPGRGARRVVFHV